MIDCLIRSYDNYKIFLQDDVPLKFVTVKLNVEIKSMKLFMFLLGKSNW